MVRRMSNKIKGILMLAPAVALIFYLIIDIWTWWTIPIVIYVFFISWWMDKAYKLLTGDE